MTETGIGSERVAGGFGTNVSWAAAGMHDLPRAQVRVVKRAWEDASVLLQEAGLPSTFETVCAIVAAGRGYPARHARGLIERAIHEEAR